MQRAKWHSIKGFVILTIILYWGEFLTRIATVDMVLWDDTRIVPCDSQPAMGNTVHTEWHGVKVV